jgi:uncharacterized repeat protein (TIGR01451 family)
MTKGINVRPVWQRIWAATVLAASALVSPAVMANSTYTANPATGTYAGSIYWMDWSGVQLPSSGSSQNVSFTLADGSTLSLTITRGGTATAGFTAAQPPSWGGSAIGNEGYCFPTCGSTTSAPYVVLYTTANLGTASGGSLNTLSFTLSGITLTNPAGNPVANYQVVMADGESTDNGDGSGANWTYTTTGGNWSQLEEVASVTGSQVSLTGLGTQTVEQPAVSSGDGPSYIVATSSPGTAGGNSNFQITATTASKSMQGVMLGIRLGQVSLTKSITARANKSDQFTYNIINSAGTSIGQGASPCAAVGPCTTTGTTTGNQTTISASVAPGNTVQLSELMASGSTSSLGAYTSTIACTNSYTGTGATTNLPNGTYNPSNPPTITLQSQSDNISCTITNNAATLSVTKGTPTITNTSGSTYTAAYTVTVANTGTATGKYTLTDTPGFPSGVTLSNMTVTTSTGALYTSSPCALNNGSATNGTTTCIPTNNTATQISASSVSLPKNSSDTYTVTITFTTSSSVPASSLTCSSNGIAGSGAFNAATVTSGSNSTSAYGCGTLPGTTAIVATKSAPVFTAAGTNTYTAVYTVTVLNTGTAPGTYTLTDTPGFPGGVTFNSSAVTTAGGTLNNPLPTLANNAAGQISATNVSIAAGVTQTYTVTINYTMSSTVPASSLTCGSGPGSGAYNAVTATPSSGTAATANNCGTLTGVPSLTVTKSAPTIANTGGNTYSATYTLTVSNTGGATGSYTLTDTPGFPSGVTLNTWTVTTANSPTTGTVNSSLPAVANNTAGQISASNVSIAAGTSATPTVHTYTVIINFVASSTVSSSSLTCTNPGSPGNGAYNATAITGSSSATANNCGTLPGVPSLTLTKSVTTSPMVVGVSDSYVLKVTNTGNGANSALVTITDVMPSSLTPGTMPTGCSLASGTVTCTVASGALAAGGGTVSFTIPVTPTSNAAPNVSNTANATGGGDPNCTGASSTNCTATIGTTVIAPPTIAKSFSPNSIAVNSTTALAFTITNPNTSSSLTGVAFSDTFPGGIKVASPSGLSNTCGGTATATAGSGSVSLSGATLTASATCTLTVNVTGTTAGTMNNSVQVTSTNGGTGNTSSATLTVTQPNLTIAKTSNAGSGGWTVGQSGATYTLTVTNTGTAATSGTITVVDTLPSGITATAGTYNGWTCGVSSQTVTCTSTASLAKTNGSSAITLPVTVGAAAATAGSVTNNASVGGGGDPNNSGNAPVPGSCAAGDNHCASTTTPVTPMANLKVTKTASPNGTYTPGQALNYTIVVTNNGPSGVSGATVSDAVPSTVTVSTWSCAATVSGSGASCGTPTSGTTNTVALSGVVLPNGTSVTITVNGTVQTSATGSIQNTATATLPSGTTCSTPPCTFTSNTTTNTDAGTPQLTIAKQATPSAFAVGQTGTYSITVTNTGTSSTSGTITVSDPMPSGITITTTPTASGWNCSTSTTTQLTCTTSAVLLPQGVAPVINASVAIANGTASPVTNVANVQGGGTSCTSATACTTSLQTVVNSPQIDVAKTLTGNLVVGQPASYVITATNNGQAATLAGTLTDNVPAGLTLGTMPSGCSATGQAVTCAIPAGLGNGGYVSYTLPVTPTSSVDGKSVANTASANNSSGDASCPAATHCSQTIDNTVTAPQLTLTKTPSVSTFTVNQPATYQLVLKNTGTAATNATATVTDTIPSGLTIGTLPANCVQNPAGSQTVVCTVASGLAINASVEFDIPVTPTDAVNGQSVVNTATATGGGDPGCVNGTAASSLPTRCAPSVTNPVNAPQLTLAKTTDVAAFSVGVQSNYILTVTNTGTAPTSGTITVTDVVPSTLQIGSLTGTGCTAQSQQVTCTSTTSLAAGSSVSFTIPVTPQTGSPASVSNTATAYGGADPTCPSTNNCASTITTSVDAPSLTITKTSNAGSGWTVGQTSPQPTFTLTVTNTGNAATTGEITAIDQMPAGITPNWTGSLTLGSWTCTYSGQTVTCQIDPGQALAATAPGNQAVLELPVNVTAAAVTSGTTAQVTNNASVGGGGDPFNGGTTPNPTSCTDANNPGHCASAIATVSTAGSVNVMKTVDASTTTPVVTGQTVTYLFTATNTGGSLVTGYTIDEVVPANTTFASVSANATTTCGGATAGTLCTITFDVPVAGTTVTASFTVAASIPNGTTNIANVMTQPDPSSCTASGCGQPPLPSVCSSATSCTPPPSCTAGDPHCAAAPVAIADMQAATTQTTIVNATVGSPVTINTSCTNAGPDAAANPTCSVTGVPVDATNVTNVCTYNGSTTFPNPLAVGDTIQCTTTFTPASAGTITLTTTAGSTTPDSNTKNNIATTQLQSGQVTPQPDSATTPFNTPVSIDVVANDTSSGTTIVPSSVTVTTPPANGTVVCNNPTAGACVYTPNNGFTGTDTFNYSVCDANGRCGTTTVTVAVGPNAVNDTNATAQNTMAAGNVSSNDTYPSGSTFTLATPPSHGTVTLSPDGSYTYTPASGYSGTDSFTYTVCSPAPNQTLCSTATVTITVGPNVVTANPDTQTTNENTPVTTNLTTNDTTSPNGSPLNPVVTVPAQGQTGAPAHGTVTCNASGCTYTPDANYYGSDSYTYTVCDTSATPVCSSSTVTVTVNAPTVTANPDTQNTTQNTPITTNVVANDTTSPNGAPLNPAVTPTQPAHGTVTCDASGNCTYTPNSDYSGPDSYTYQVCDTSTPTPVCSSTTVTVNVGANTVTPQPDTGSTTYQTPVTTNVVANDTVSAGGALLNPASVMVATPPSHGTVVCNTPTAGECTYTPNAGFSGQDVYTYTVCDTSTPTPVCGSTTVTIQVGPNAVNDTNSTSQNTAVSGNVSSNDTYPQGATFAQASNPQNGTLVFNADGTYTYTPNADFSGTDTFTYQVCNPTTPAGGTQTDPNLCSTATVTIAVGSNTVTPQPDQGTTPYGQAVTTDVIANDTVSAGGAPLNPASVTVTQQPANGTVTCDATGNCTYTPKAGFSGTDTYTYQVCDTSTPKPVCGSTTVTIEVGPNAVNDNVATQQNQGVSGNVGTNDTYPQGATFAQTGTPPAHGTVTVNPDGSYTYTPGTNYVGADTFQYQVCEQPLPGGDANDPNLCSTATVTVTIGGTAPTANPDSATTPQNTAVTTNVLANDTVAPGGAPLNPASVTVTTQPAHGTATCDTIGNCTYTPAANYSGLDSYIYQVCDTSTPTPQCASAVVSVTVQPNVVTANADSATTAQNTAVTTNVIANDTVSANGAPLNPASVTVTTPPNDGTVTCDTTGNCKYTPNAGFSGTDTYMYQVCDESTPTPVCNSAQVTVNVGSNAVTANPDTSTTAYGTAVTTDVIANDTVDTGGAPLNPSSVTVTTPPKNGTVVCNNSTAGSCVYTPNAGFSGTDTYMYQVCDTSTPTSACASALVTIVVGPNAANDSATTAQNTAVSGNVSSNDTYPSGSTFTATTQPGHGTVTMNPTGSYTYTPATGYTGTDTFTYEVCSPAPNQGLCSTATVTINVASGETDLMATGAPTQTVRVNTLVTVVTTCTNNGPLAAVNATCTVTGPVFTSGTSGSGAAVARSEVMGGMSRKAFAAAASTPTVITNCTPTMPVASFAVAAVITCTTQFTPAQAGTYAFTTTVSSDTSDSNPSNNVAQSVVVAIDSTSTPPVAVPLNARWMLGLLMLMLGALAFAETRKRQR